MPFKAELEIMKLFDLSPTIVGLLSGMAKSGKLRREKWAFYSTLRSGKFSLALRCARSCRLGYSGNVNVARKTLS